MVEDTCGVTRKSVLYNRVLLVFALLFTLWATSRWIEVFASSPAPGAQSERRARVLELICSTIAGLLATGFSSRSVFRHALGAPGANVIAEDEWRYVGPVVTLGPNDVVEVSTQEKGPGWDTLLQNSTATARSANERRRAEQAAVSSDIGSMAPADRSARDTRQPLPANTECSQWVGHAMECLAHDLTLINGYTDLLIADSPGQMAGELKQIRRAGERSALMVQQFRFVEGSLGVATSSLDLNALVDLIRPRLRSLLSPDVELAMSLHSDGIRVQGDPGSLAIAIGSLVAEADRVNAGPRQIRLATGDNTLTVETASGSSTASPASSPASSPGFKAADSIVRLLGGTLAVVELPGQLLFRLSLPASLDAASAICVNS